MTVRLTYKYLDCEIEKRIVWQGDLLEEKGKSGSLIRLDCRG